MEFVVNNGFCYNFWLGVFDILDKGYVVEMYRLLINFDFVGLLVNFNKFNLIYL